MKLENRKIAVCFSGQPRTYKHCSESINNFFTSKRGNQYVFFGHAWDSNDYKIRTPSGVEMVYERDLNITEIETGLNNHFNFAKLIVEKDIYRPYPWASMFYSIMRSNFLKQKYEIENNMMFDLVIKFRYDLCTKPGFTFEDVFDKPVIEKTLYTYYFGHMTHEYNLPVGDDVWYCGTSLTMDLIDSLYTALATGSFLKSLGHNQDNPAYSRVGPNVLINTWASMKKMLFVHSQIEYLVYRKYVEGIDYKDWDKLRKAINNF